MLIKLAIRNVIRNHGLSRSFRRALSSCRGITGLRLHAVGEISAGKEDIEVRDYLRKKLAHACGGDNYIETVWGRGYVLRDANDQMEAA